MDLKYPRGHAFSLKRRRVEHDELPPLPSLSNEICLETFTHPSMGTLFPVNTRFMEVGRRVLDSALTFANAAVCMNTKSMSIEDSHYEKWVDGYALRVKLRYHPDMEPPIFTPEDTQALFCAFVGGVYTQHGTWKAQSWISTLLHIDGATSLIAEPQVKRLRRAPPDEREPSSSATGSSTIAVAFSPTTALSSSPIASNVVVSHTPTGKDNDMIDESETTLPRISAPSYNNSNGFTQIKDSHTRASSIIATDTHDSNASGDAGTSTPPDEDAADDAAGLSAVPSVPIPSRLSSLSPLSSPPASRHRSETPMSLASSSPSPEHPMSLSQPSHPYVEPSTSPDELPFPTTATNRLSTPKKATTPKPDSKILTGKTEPASYEDLFNLLMSPQTCSSSINGEGLRMSAEVQTASSQIEADMLLSDSHQVGELDSHRSQEVSPPIVDSLPKFNDAQTGSEPKELGPTTAMATLPPPAEPLSSKEVAPSPKFVSSGAWTFADPMAPLAAVSHKSPPAGDLWKCAPVPTRKDAAKLPMAKSSYGLFAPRQTLTRTLTAMTSKPSTSTPKAPAVVRANTGSGASRNGNTTRDSHARIQELFLARSPASQSSSTSPAPKVTRSPDDDVPLSAATMYNKSKFIPLRPASDSSSGGSQSQSRQVAASHDYSSIYPTSSSTPPSFSRPHPTKKPPIVPPPPLPSSQAPPPPHRPVIEQPSPPPKSQPPPIPQKPLSKLKTAPRRSLGGSAPRVSLTVLGSGNTESISEIKQELAPAQIPPERRPWVSNPKPIQAPAPAPLKSHPLPPRPPGNIPTGPRRNRDSIINGSGHGHGRPSAFWSRR